MKSAPFTKRTVVILATVGTISLMALLYLLIAEEEPDPERSAGANGFSRSAVGHRAFVETLRELDVPVTVSRFSTGSRAADTAVLVVAEPKVVTEEDREKLRAMVDAADRVLLVLPKRVPWPDEFRRGFVRRAELMPEERPQEILDALGIEGEVVRPVLPEAMPKPRTGPAPTTVGLQLVRGGLEEHLAGPSGTLVGAVPGSGKKVWVLADPDPLENHGIGRGENAAFVVDLVERLREGRMPVLVDETLHGFETPPALFASLFRFPLVLVLISACVVLALLLLAATGRFGAPEPDAPAINPGKDVLLSNTADLLAAGSHAGYVVSKYLRATFEEVTRARHAPRGLTASQRLAWLTRVEGERAVTDRAGDLEHAARSLRKRLSWDAARPLALARRIHRYREEMKDGA